MQLHDSTLCTWELDVVLSGDFIHIDWCVVIMRIERLECLDTDIEKGFEFVRIEYTLLGAMRGVGFGGHLGRFFWGYSR